MINHSDHNIILVSKENTKAFYFIELTDTIGNKYGFQWIVQKITNESKFKNCWMTIGVSQPVQLAKST